MTIDVLIVGQGICGTFLSWNLHKRGLKVLVVDEPQPFSATKVASGVINPVTGRQVVTTWMADELLEFVLSEYGAIGKDINANVITQKNIIAFPPSQQMKDAYDKRIGEENSYIKPISAADAAMYNDFIFSMYGSAEISPVYLIDLHPLLHGWRTILRERNCLVEERFDNTQLIVNDVSVQYKNITAQKIIFCNGTGSFSLPYWQIQPYVFNKGEALIVDVPGLPATHIYKIANSTLVPWYDGLWWLGSSYENSYADDLPTPLFQHKKTQELQQHVKLPFTIVDHLASLRPAVAVERRPFVGFHPTKLSLGILNGMGTKGCSLAPWFAKQLTENLLDNKLIDPLADVKRFRRILS